MCELSVGDERQQSEQDEGDKHWHDNWNTWDEHWVQNEMTDGHKIELTDGLKSGLSQNLVQKLDPEQVDGWPQHLEQKLARQVGV